MTVQFFLVAQNVCFLDNDLRAKGVYLKCPQQGNHGVFFKGSGELAQAVIECDTLDFCCFIFQNHRLHRFPVFFCVFGIDFFQDTNYFDRGGEVKRG